MDSIDLLAGILPNRDRPGTPRRSVWLGPRSRPTLWKTGTGMA